MPAILQALERIADMAHSYRVCFIASANISSAVWSQGGSSASVSPSGVVRLPQRITPAPRVKPAPNAANRTWSPGLMRPCSSISHKAIGMVAADVLAYFSILTATFSIGTLRKCASESMILKLAWCGRIRSMS